ncbi:MAG: SAM-dependent methyltransferase [Pseudomonadota bacterium]|nr:SAM-dependent methyltransferase [Pseudomonadota bacterium]
MAAANAHYYATRDPLGEAGDFVTAPEISQMFGEIIGAALAEAWIGAGSPSDAIYAELGPGRGTLAIDALRVLRRVGFSGEVHLVETSPALRKMQAGLLPDAIFHKGLEDLPPRPPLLVANEFFDALPIEQWVGTEQQKITYDGNQFTFTADGSVRETSPARDAAAAALAQHLVHHGGTALIVDYGYANGEQGDTFQAARGHAFADPLSNPGEADLSAHVDFAALASAASSCSVSRAMTQGSWLETLGIGPRAAHLAARNPEQTAAIAAARRRLCDEAEMGQLFKVMSLRHPQWPAMAGFEP